MSAQLSPMIDDRAAALERLIHERVELRTCIAREEAECYRLQAQIDDEAPPAEERPWLERRIRSLRGHLSQAHARLIEAHAEYDAVRRSGLYAS